MKAGTNPRLILFHPNPLQKPGLFSPPQRLHLLFFISLFTLFLLFLAILTTKHITSSSPSSASSSSSSSSSSSHPPPLPLFVVDALLHYSSASNATAHMSSSDLRSISAALRRCSSPCNFLIFGLGHETLLWKAVNYNGRTVFLDENEYFAAWFEAKHPHLETYDVRYTTTVAQMPQLIAAAEKQIRNECRPVQNLLFSDCALAINDLPNQLYDIDWDVILVDGPRGYSPTAPGRMSAIFTAAVLARSKRGGGATHIFVHDFDREVERVCSERFLCRENMVESCASMAHFVVERMKPEVFEFCGNHTTTTRSSSSSK
ncbi:protein IRX15-LIKE-like protein [Cinnamomum micranthum f. kanehirae]|uniref:Protein IRX15-LIKE-like protein n=1 Tax=Cinnamomum micranthum f. kanehirae TaxID=337451 RepID=A0A3S3NRH4_9MAGN|nr:protein IRX15-LIKE-like protein [Cinnamomum micranthum f. kanehirae]